MKIRMKGKVSLAILLSLIVLGSFSTIQTLVFGSQTVTYKGYVKQVDDSPIAGATVGLYSGGLIKQKNTNAQGYYEFTATTYEYTPYFLKASKSGYVTEQLFASSNGGTYNFELTSIETSYTGNIYDETNGNSPIEGARVRLLSPIYLTVLDEDYTDSSGEYYV